MEREINRTLELVRSSKREMPAYYKGINNRRSGFCINFPQMKEEDEQIMAQEAYDYLENSCPFHTAPSELHWHALLKLGEDCIAGAFILTQLGKPSNMPELLPELIKDVFDRLGEHEDVQSRWFITDECMKYIHHCIEFGMKRGLTFSLS